MLAVIVYDGYPVETRTSPAQMNAAQAEAMTRAREEVESNRFRIGECRPVHQGLLTGRECDLTVPGSELTGRMQVFATSTRDLILIGTRGITTAELEPINRFFSSVVIQSN